MREEEDISIKRELGKTKFVGFNTPTIIMTTFKFPKVRFLMKKQGVLILSIKDTNQIP